MALALPAAPVLPWRSERPLIRWALASHIFVSFLEEHHFRCTVGCPAILQQLFSVQSVGGQIQHTWKESWVTGAFSLAAVK